MENFDPRLYGARWADNYDEFHTGMMDTEGAAAALHELADGGPVLELGVGTGRVAVPLAELGTEVVGVDISPEMLAKLREKASGVTAVEGDMTTVRLDREFSLAYVVFNSIFVLDSQDAQVRLFENAAAHLRPGGRFALETVVIRPPSPDRGRLAVADIEPDRVMLVGGQSDPVTGRHKGMWLSLDADGPKFFPIFGREVSHFEMDLMARIAGLELENRWGDWKRAPFTARSELHVSVYRKP
ncbi:class I SAM-dependent DNA methyltransferase [Actinophytocola oryzae]|uniref:Methyltransferase family protein n=1 Tax=Actinophytocola oryzae TaxID=502181 RepID=A0A4V6Q6I3_9PSEU|nr:class I SAM-dependent methyltransferase [Actinophytocola oryzae]TDV40141.1 methyltransferase family protein [Actinophytocola oryzae]